MMTVELQYGADRRFVWQLPSSCTATLAGGPRHDIDVLLTARDSFAQPLEMPPLSAAIVPGDRVVVPLERGTPLLHRLLPALVSELTAVGVEPGDILLLQPAGLDLASRRDPREFLGPDVRDIVGWKVHDPTADDSCGYLASSASGERIYLAREILDADFVLPLSVAGFDPMVGYKHPCGVLYPGLSNTEAFKKTHGQGHQEIPPEDERPLRQLIDETGWLLGVQYAVQMAPSARRGETSEILVGGVEAVGRRARKLLDRDWRVHLNERVDTVIAAIPSDQQAVSWSLLGTALEAAKTLVERGGKIIVLSDLAAEPGPGVRTLREQRSAKAALQPLRTQAPEDLLPATQLASAADWATVYLLSRLETTLVEELFCTPLENEQELARLLAGVERCVVLCAAQFVHGQIGDD
ncbi:MAG: lactate racemase domain-containing protein [Planctomycetaceae bacterium]|nr:lactate racemase domain-containing protein [Planctomycetaceae bacterium]